VYVWVSNESEATEVWFDDVSVIHRKPLVAQATDYEAWGGVLREQKWIDMDAKYRYGYQGKYAERDDETGWNHFELREYDPVIGRWFQMDPEGQFYSPYVGMGNNPVSGTDPDGGYSLFGALWRNIAYGMKGHSIKHDDGLGYGYRDKNGDIQFGGGSFLSQINPVESVDVYVGGVAKTEIAKGPVKVVIPMGGLQLSANTNDGGRADFITLEQTYLNFQKGPVDLRIIPVNGVNTGDYDPSFRGLFTGAQGLIPLADLPIPIGQWKLQGDVTLNPITTRYSIGGRGVAETFSFPSWKKGASGFRLEANAGFRFRLKVPDILKK
jgi:RHS repeat-associated protein